MAVSIAMPNPWVFVLVTFLAASVLALILITKQGNLRKRLKRVIDYIRFIIFFKSVPIYEDTPVTNKEKQRYSIHLSVPILAASVICLGKRLFM